MNQANRTWTSKTDDFFPYSIRSHGYLTGYFTSRAALKGYERHSNNILQVTRQLNALSNSDLRDHIFYLSKNNFFSNIYFEEYTIFLLIQGEPMGIAQHHDAVTGTEKQEVAFDYAQRLANGIDIAQVYIICVIQEYFICIDICFYLECGQ